MSEPVVEVVERFSKFKIDAFKMVGVVQSNKILKSRNIIISIFSINGLADIGFMKPRSNVSKSYTIHIFTQKRFRIGSFSVELEPDYVVKKKKSGER